MTQRPLSPPARIAPLGGGAWLVLRSGVTSGGRAQPSTTGACVGIEGIAVVPAR